MYHVGLKIGESDTELREALAQVQAAGVEIVGSADHTVTHSLYILDPDGNEIELYVDVPGVDWASDPQAIAAPVKALRLRSSHTHRWWRACPGVSMHSSRTAKPVRRKSIGVQPLCSGVTEGHPL